MNDRNRFSRSDRIASVVLSGVTGAIFGVLGAWGVNATAPWLVLAALSGSVAMVALGSILVRVMNRSPAQSICAVTEAPTAPKKMSEATAQVNREQQPLFRILGLFDGLIWGGNLGAVLCFLSAMWVGSKHPLAYATVGAIVGALIGTAVFRRGYSAAISAQVVVLRSLGLPVGYAVIGGVLGAMLGAELWHRWQGHWSVTGALVVGIPFAILNAVLGFHRLRHYRRANND